MRNGSGERRREKHGCLLTKLSLARARNAAKRGTGERRADRSGGLVQVPHTRYVRGSNHCHIAVFQDRLAGRAIIISVIDNLVKGASGQALQNMNLILGYPEDLGLNQQPMFP
jgi:hypothetical protein